MAKQAHGKAPRRLVRMRELARLSGTPAPTLKHYLREGLIEAAVRTSRNSALYDAALVPKIRKIKELQASRFLPLRVIKKVLQGGRVVDDDVALAAAISRVLDRKGPQERRSREELVEAGALDREIDWLEAKKLLSAKLVGGTKVYSGDGLALLRTLVEVRRSGLAELLPLDVLETYLAVLRELVREELRIFRKHVLPRAGKRLPELSESAVVLSERLVVLMRRELLLPTLDSLVKERKSAAPREASSRSKGGSS